MSGPAPVPGNVAAGGDAVADAAEGDVFAASRERFDEMVSFLHAEQAGALEHAELETRLDAQGRELLRQLLQDHLDLRAAREQRLSGYATSTGGAHGGRDRAPARRWPPSSGRCT